MAVFGFLMGIWEHLAYKRCLSLGDDLNHVPDSEKFTTDSITTLKLADDSESVKNERQPFGSIYCPKCGSPSGKNQSFCASCGADLEMIRTTLGNRHPDSWFDRKLTEYVVHRSSDAQLNKAATLCILLGFLYALTGGANKNFLFIGLAAMYLLIGIWDYLVYRRSRKADDEAIATLALPKRDSQTKELEPASEESISFTGELTRKLSQPVERK